MKTICSFTLILFTALLSAGTLRAQDNTTSQPSDTTSASSQTEDDGHIFVIVTWETLRPEGGTVAERDSLMTLFYDQMIKKNEYIVSEKNLWHLYGKNSGDWVVITEYANWADIEKASDRQNELMQEKWTTPEERRTFNRALAKYFGNHSDEIYQEVTQLAK